MASLRVLAFESRRAVEMAALIRKQGGDPFVAPSMREVPLAEQPAALAFARALVAGTIDVVVCLTGVGTRALADAVEPVLPRAAFAERLARTTIVARGPKPVAALRELGVAPAVTVPEPNTWRELLAALDGVALTGKHVAIQEYGIANPELVAGLEARGANVMPVPVYRWALPDDLGPLHEAIDRIASLRVDVVLFTSATQVTHVLRIADERAARDGLASGLAQAVVGSIGPVCSDALRAAGLPVDYEPTHPKMGRLVSETLRAAPAILPAKRG
ncbi:MAG: uroporphyrinogen-III synthase [Candidatus Binatia bacterium]